MLVIDQRLAIPLREFEFSFARSSGPGGQNVNKVNTKVTLRWPFTTSQSLPEDVKARFATRYGRRISKQGDLLITSQRFRDQGRNVADCLSKLRAMVLTVAEPPKARKPTRPSKASHRRRLDNKRKRSQTKQGRKKPSLDA
jgi:ribosome-associated protein